jgi:hypothetical protein
VPAAGSHAAEVKERIASFSGARKTILTFDEQRSMRDSFAPQVWARIGARRTT